MKKFYLLHFCLIIANSLFAQASFQTAKNNRHFQPESQFYNAYDTLPNGLIIKPETGEIVENNFVPSAFYKSDRRKQTLTPKSGNKSAAKFEHPVLSKSRTNRLNMLKSITLENFSFQKDKIDSMVFYSVEDTPQYDLKRIKGLKIIIEKDKDGNVTMQIDQKLDTVSGVYINDIKTEYSESGNTTKMIKYNWNEELWIPVQKTESDYNNNRQILQRKTYTWQTDSWQLQSSYTYTYHNNGKLATYYIQGGNQEVEYNYNEESKQTLYLYKYNYSYDTGWRVYDRREFNYLEDGTIEENRYTWDSQTQQLIQIGSELYRFNETFVGENLVDQIRYDYSNGEWITTERKLYDYDNNKHVTADISLVFQNGNWVTTKQVFSEYDEWGNRTFYEINELVDGISLITRQRIITTANESGLRIKEQRLIWDEATYTLRDEALLQWEYDENNQTTSYSAAVWDTEKQQLVPYFKYIYSYPNELERISEYYEYEDLGRSSSNYAAYETLTFTYDSINGRYTSIIDHYDTERSTTKFIYDENLKLVKRVEFDENGEERSNKGRYYYDKLGRDSLWVINWFYSETLQDTVKLYTEFTYTDISPEINTITEHWYDNQSDTIFDKYGRIIGYGGYMDELVKYTFDNGNITKWIDYEKIENEWIADDSMMYSYNDAGQIHTSLYVCDHYQTKLEYNLSNDTLTLNEYWDEEIDSLNWEHIRKTIYLLDASYSKNQIQHFPNTFFEDRMHYPIDWRFPYDFGKVLEIIYYEKREVNGELVGDFIERDKDIFYYSPASILSGDGIISGYIFEGKSSTKSVSVTAENNGTPIEGVAVALCAKENDFVLATDTTDENGLYRFKGIPDGDFYIKVVIDGFMQSSTYNVEVSWYQSQFANKNFSVSDGEIYTGINELDQNIKVFPNPASEFIRINSINPVVSAKIIDLNGHIHLLYENLNSKNPILSLKSLPSGLYFIDIKTIPKSIKEKILITR